MGDFSFDFRDANDLMLYLHVSFLLPVKITTNTEDCISFPSWVLSGSKTSAIIPIDIIP